MKVTDKDVTYVDDLANLELTDLERQRMLKDLNSILDYIDRLNELDTTDVPPMAQVADQSSQSGTAPGGNAAYPWRKDTPRPSLPRVDALKNAPETDGEFFKVPKVIEK
jgi:aspartyl-tRNA(Asn)/glutamyl-tRNA(Gln) amidotransferase subunit C